MRKIMSFGIATVVVAAAITAWAASAPRSKTPVELTTVTINPLVLMTASKGLQVEEWEWF
jgi:hypothetical protein